MSQHLFCVGLVGLMLQTSRFDKCAAAQVELVKPMATLLHQFLTQPATAAASEAAKLAAAGKALSVEKAGVGECWLSLPLHRAVLVSWCAGPAHSDRNIHLCWCAEGVVQALLKLTTVIKHVTPVPPSGKRTPSVTLLDQVHARLPFVVSGSTKGAPAHPTLSFIGDVCTKHQLWPTLEAVSTTFADQTRIVEKLTRLYKHTIKAFKDDAAVLVERMVKQCHTRFMARPHSSYL